LPEETLRRIEDKAGGFKIPVTSQRLATERQYTLTSIGLKPRKEESLYLALKGEAIPFAGQTLEKKQYNTS
jgi:hypothetical protein